MKIGDLIQNLHRMEIKLHEGVRDGELLTETGDSLFPDEIGVILGTTFRTLPSTRIHVYHRILTPRNTSGWIYEENIRSISG